MKAPPCEHCGRRDTSFTSLWIRAQRTIRNQRRTMRQLRHDIAVANALAADRKAQIADLEGGLHPVVPQATGGEHVLLEGVCGGGAQGEPGAQRTTATGCGVSMSERMPTPGKHVITSQGFSITDEVGFRAEKCPRGAQTPGGLEQDLIRRPAQ